MDPTACGMGSSEKHSDQQENIPPNQQNLPLHNRSASSGSSSSASGVSNQQKKRKQNNKKVNQMYKEAYKNMETSTMYLQQRVQALQASSSRAPLPGPCTSSESQRTPSPEFAPSASQTSSPVPHLQYCQPPASHGRSPPEHNYAVSSASSSTATASSRNEAEASPGRPVDSDSGNSTLTDEISPLCTADWYKDLLKPEYAEKLQTELQLIISRSEALKEAAIAAKIAQLPNTAEYFPNKSRMRKEYPDETRKAERERNNQASRRSRFKKKRAQVVLNMHLEYDRNENAYLYAMQNWIAKIIFQLEAQWLKKGATAEELCRLRRECGFPQNLKPVIRLE